MDLGLEEVNKTDFAELLMVLGADDERSIGVAKDTWCWRHASSLA